MPKPIYIAQIMGPMVGGGLEATIMNHYRHIDHDKIQFDFIVQEDSTHVPEKEILSYGGKIYTIPSYKHLNDYMKSLNDLFSSYRPDIVHSNMNALSVFPLKAAKDANIPIRIAHSHSTSNNRELVRTAIKNSLRPFSKIYPTHLAACGRYSAEWLFGKRTVQQNKVHYIKNAIDLERFSFDPVSRSEIRNAYGISNKFVVGQVGRFTTQKNHSFSLEVFKKLHDINNNAVFVMLGSGELMQPMKEKAKELGIDKDVLFLGQRDDAPRWYSVFDTLLFPSLYEGLPLTAIEAQASGLPIVAADTITSEAFIEKELIQILSLKDSPTKWSNTLNIIANNQNINKRSDHTKSLALHGYDIQSSAAELEEWYNKIHLR